MGDKQYKLFSAVGSARLVSSPYRKTVMGSMLLVILTLVAGQWLTQSPRTMASPACIVASDEESPYIQAWNCTWGGARNDVGYGVAVTADRSVYLAGSTNSFGVGSYDAFLAKYAANGTQLWNRTWGGADSDWGYSVAFATDGVYLAGYTESFGAGCDAFLAKYAANGTQLWNRTWGGTFIERGNGVSVAADGAVYLAGYTFSFGVAGSGDAFLAKFDPDGTQLWNRTWGGVDSDLGYSVAAAADGVYLAGNTQSFGAGSGDGDAFLAKFDPDGTQLWNRTWGGTNWDEGHAVTVGVDGVFLAGNTGSFGVAGSDAFLAKYAANGTQLWNRTWGGAETDWGDSVAAAADGVYLAGFQESGLLGFLVQFNSNGTILWNLTFSEIDYMYGLGMGISVNVVYLTGIGVGGDAYIAKWVPDQPPDITRPGNLTYTHGISGNNISWIVTDNGINITSYTIVRNGTVVGSGTWINGTSVSIAIDGLAIGQYNYTIIADDGLGGMVQDTVLVVVTNAVPHITSSGDITYTYGTTGDSVSWTISDASIGTTPTYVVYLDGEPRQSGPWTSGLPIIANIDSISVGVHNLTIVVLDDLGGRVQDTVIVTVTSSAPPGGNWWEQPWVWSVVGATATVTFGIIKLVNDKSRKRKKAGKEFKVLDWKVLEKLGVAKAEDAAVILDLVEREPNSSLNRMRTLIESVVNYLYMQTFPKTKDLSHISLGDRIHDLNEKGIFPAAIYVHLNSLRFIGNLGVHTKEATTKDAASTLPMLVNFLEWFIEFEKKTNQP
nr:DUF4145 domain-containing protein [Candidatus Sigynarchaeum springense]